MTEKMKPSGIAWIGSIPQDWKCKRYRFCGNVQYGYPFNSDYFSNEETGFPLIRIRDITSGEIATYYEGTYPDEYIVKSGDVLVGMDGDFSVRVWNNNDALLNQRCCRILDSQEISKRFMAYYLPHYLKVINDLTWSTTVKHLLADDINNIYVSYPTMDEQQAIADYLDAQCAKIDGVIADIEKQIETLQKYKKSLITETVTKGLERSVPMKDSGVKWIGLIPSHWELTRIKYISIKIGSGKTPKGGAEVYEDEGITFIRSQNVYDDGLHLEDVKYISENIDAEMYSTRLIPGDVLFNITGASIGRCCVYSLQDKGNVNQHVCIIRASRACNNEYLRYVLNSDIGKVQTAINQMGGNRDSLTFEQIGMFELPLPPVCEQEDIVHELTANCTKIDGIISYKQKQLETIKKHKKSLIYEYVTGKKRVTEVN